MTHEELKQQEATYQASHDAYAEVVEWCNDKTLSRKTIELLAAEERDDYANQLAKLEGQTVVIADETAAKEEKPKVRFVTKSGGDTGWVYFVIPGTVEGLSLGSYITHAPFVIVRLDIKPTTFWRKKAKDLTIIPNPHNDKQLEQELREMGVE